MNAIDYTFADYENLLDAAINAAYEFLSVEKYLRAIELPERFIVLRHDVDRKEANAAIMAKCEAARDITATYYFRTSTFDSELIQTIADQGHEIGYHYEDLSQTDGDIRAAHQRFQEQLGRFRQHAAIDTVCAHGSPLSRYTNTDMWKNGHSPEAYGLLGEAYLSIDVNTELGLDYFSDTGRTWATQPPSISAIRTTDDLIKAIERQTCSQIYLLTHPSRWANSQLELIERLTWDIGAEATKFLVSKLPQSSVYSLS